MSDALKRMFSAQVSHAVASGLPAMPMKSFGDIAREGGDRITYTVMTAPGGMIAVQVDGQQTGVRFGFTLNEAKRFISDLSKTVKEVEDSVHDQAREEQGRIRSRRGSPQNRATRRRHRNQGER